MKEKLTKETTDAELAQVFALQAAWKDGPMRTVACTIVRSALARNGTGVWPDAPEIVESVQKLRMEDRNCVGTAWRWMLVTGLLTRSGERRRSTAGTTRGREIARWDIAKRAAAETFLRRNAAAFEPAERQRPLGGGLHP